MEADVKTMCAQAELPYEDFGGYAQLAANRVRNMVITKAKDVNVPPQMRRTGLKPDVSEMRVFGCVAYVHQVKNRRTTYKGSKR